MAESSDLMIEIEQELMENIARRLAMKGDLEAPNYTTLWAQEKLLEVQRLKEDNLKSIKGLIKPTLQAVDADIIEAGVNAVEAIEPDFITAKNAGATLNPVLPYKEDPGLKRIVDSYSRIGRTNAKLIIDNINLSADNVYINSINKTVQKVTLGISTPQEALRQTMREWSDKGLPAFIDKSGRTWTAESYYNNVLRTTIRNTTTDVQFERMDQYGTDLLEVSSHLGARPKCAADQGKVYSRSGDSEKYPPFSSTSYGDRDGLLGNNCKHQIYPFFEGISTTSFKRPNASRNDKNYENSQIQRRYERDIKKAKREKAIFKANEDPQGVKEANQLLKGRNDRMETFLDKTGRTRRSNRELIYNVDGSKNRSERLKETAATSSSKAKAKRIVNKPIEKVHKKWVILENDEVVNSFDTKEAARNFGSSQRKQGKQVFLWNKKEVNQFRSPERQIR